MSLLDDCEITAFENLLVTAELARRGEPRHLLEEVDPMAIPAFLDRRPVTVEANAAPSQDLGFGCYPGRWVRIEPETAHRILRYLIEVSAPS